MSQSLPTEVAEEVFNRCTSTNETKDGQVRPDSKDYRVFFNYEFLEDFRDPESRAEKLRRALTQKYVLNHVPPLFPSLLSPHL